MDNLTHLVGESRQKILALVKDRGEITATQTADELELALTTVRQHFARLESDALIERTSRPSGPGRPVVYYRLSASARRMYPSSDADMLSNLLDFLSTQGYHRAIDDFFRHYWQQRHQALQNRLEEANAHTMTQRLEVLHAFLDEQGFMPRITMDDDGAVEIRECNCPLRGSVKSTRLPCRLEAEFLEEIVGQELTRAEYIPDGHNACIYQFKAPENT